MSSSPIIRPIPLFPLLYDPFPSSTTYSLFYDLFPSSMTYSPFYDLFPSSTSIFPLFYDLFPLLRPLTLFYDLFLLLQPLFPLPLFNNHLSLCLLLRPFVLFYDLFPSSTTSSTTIFPSSAPFCTTSSAFYDPFLPSSSPSPAPPAAGHRPRSQYHPVVIQLNRERLRSNCSSGPLKNSRAVEEHQSLVSVSSGGPGPYQLHGVTGARS